MRILVTNDDGIESEGILRLASMAAELGEVWVVAPEIQCSGMSHRISVKRKLRITERGLPVPGVRAFSVSGTPADCVKLGLQHILRDQKPDYVFSGINDGYNAGFDIAYSGTVGAAMEGLLNGIPAIAFSNEHVDKNEVTDHYMKSLALEMIEKNPLYDRIWNVNFPGCTLEECKGVLWFRRPGKESFYQARYAVTETPEGKEYELMSIPSTEDIYADSSDLSALINRYVSVGTVPCSVIRHPMRVKT